MKVEVYLKLANLPYKAVTGSDPRRAPKGKMPYIEQDDGPTVADSHAIIDHLEKKSKQPLDEGMTDADNARAHVIRRTLEEGLYFVVLWTRWVEDEGWNVVKSFFDVIPGAVRWIVAPMIRKKISGSIIAQGTGRHSREEIYEIGKRDIDALSILLGDGPYFTGERMRTIDIAAYAFLANILKFEVATPLTERLKTKSNLVAFVERVAARVDEATTSAKKSS
jgi:glutathione S-transferase